MVSVIVNHYSHWLAGITQRDGLRLRKNQSAILPVLMYAAGNFPLLVISYTAGLDLIATV